MKTKIIITVFALSLILSLTGCGNKKMDGNNMDSMREYASDQMLNNDLSANDTTSNASISRDEAKQIALKQAGVAEGDIYDYEIELDKDFGVLVYEIEFNVDGTEYKYEVNAQSGKITERKIDID